MIHSQDAASSTQNVLKTHICGNGQKNMRKQYKKRPQGIEFQKVQFPAFTSRKLFLYYLSNQCDIMLIYGIIAIKSKIPCRVLNDLILYIKI